MTGPELSTALQTLGLDTQAAAKWLGVSVRAVQRYRVSGAPGPVAGMVRQRIAGHRAVKEMREAAETLSLEGYFNCARTLAHESNLLSLALDWRE